MAAARVVSVHIGQIAPLGPDAVPSGFVKPPVAAANQVTALGLVGDQQADLRVHGGLEKAAYGYSIVHYAAWRSEYPHHRWSSMQENQSPPRVGLDKHVVAERNVMSRAKSISSQCVRPVFVNGDRVVIRWIFHFEWLDGTVTHMEELAYQRWEGERIAEETFFYDPAQRVPRRVQP
jgi:hypothetical protein